MWEMKKLGDVCRIELGKTPARSNENFWDEVKHTKNIWLSIADMTKQNYLSINDSAEYISDAGAKLCKKVPKGTLLASFKLTLGRLGFTGCDLYTNEAIAALYIHNKKELLKQYLYWYLTYFDWNEYASSDIKVKGKTLNKEKLKLLNIILPPLKTQQAIVAKLDETFAELEKLQQHTEQNLINANELFNSYLNKIFTTKGDDWVEKKLGDVCENLDSKRIPITKNKRIKGQYPYYGASGIVDYISKYIFEETLLLVSEDGANLLARTYPIAFTASGKIWVNNHAHVLRFKSIVSHKFMKYYLNSISLASYVTGMAQPKLNQKSLNSIIVPYPPLKTQQTIVSKLDKLANEVNQLKTIYNQKLKELAELKQSILEQAFNGKLNI